MTGLSYSDDLLRAVLTSVKTVALAGASDDPSRPSYQVMEYLLAHGYRVFPINPRLAGQTLLGQSVYARLADLPETVDMVDVFRNSAAAGPVMDDAVAHGARVIWLQLDVRNDDAAARAAAAGATVIMDRCPKIEHRRLGL